MFDLPCGRRLIRNYILDNYLSAPHLHDKRVLEIQRRVREWQASNREGGQLCTARPQWIRVAMRIGACPRPRDGPRALLPARVVPNTTGDARGAPRAEIEE